MMRRVVGTIFLLIISVLGFGQKEWSNWYFNGGSLLTFKNNNVAQAVGNFTPADAMYTYNSSTGLSYSDPATGQMRFIVSLYSGYDKNFKFIRAPQNLRYCNGDRYGYHIIPFQNNPDKFYIVQFQSAYADILSAQTGLQVRCPNAIGLGYSILDLTLNNGLGSFTSMNNILQSFTSEGISLVRHANGKDTWVIVHSYNDKKFYSYLFTDAGVSAPIVTAIGPVVQTSAPAGGSGYISASHDGKTLAVKMMDNNFLEFYDFDNFGGSLKNYRTVSTTGSAACLTFSPDDSKLYFLGNIYGSGVYQLDLSAPSVTGSLTKITDEKYTSFYDMQLGLDGKIYLSGYYEYELNKNYLPVIRCPNLAKYACNYDLRGFEAPYGGGWYPDLINDFIKQPKATPAKEFSLCKDTAICFGSYKLSAPEGWQRYRWNTGEETREITVTQAGLYYVLAGDEGFSCPTAFGSITISNAAKKLNLGKDTVLCPKNIYTINIANTYKNLSWSDGTTSSNKQISIGGNYSLVAEDENGCRTSDTVYVGFRYDPRANFGADTTLCTNQSITLQLLPRPNAFDKSGVYLWQDGSKADSFKVTQKGTYWGKIAYQGCSVSDTIQVNYVNAQSVNLGNDTALCKGDSLLLKTDIVNGNYLWSTGHTGPTLSVKNSGTYWVRINNGSCTIADTININFRDGTALFLGNDTTLCEKQKIILRAPLPGATYVWQDGSTQNSFEASQPGTYVLKLTQNGCVTNDTIKINYKSLPTLSLGSDTGMCAGQTLLLNAAHSSIRDYLWQDGSTLPTLPVNNTGIYTVTVTGVNGCVNEDTIRITTATLPEFTLGNDTTLCDQQQLNISLNVTSAVYKWSTGNSTNNYTITKSGIYWVQVSQNGCFKQDTIMVNFKPLATVNLGNDTILCEGTTKILTALNTGASYQWQDLSTQPIFLVTKPGLYHVTANLNGCIKSDSIQVSYKYIPTFTLGNDTTLCTGEQLLLHPTTSNASFLWQNGSRNTTFNVQEAGTYKLIATNECGSSSDEIIISIGLCNLYLPNAFTPDNNGSNDLFRLQNPGFVKIFKMTIYNRWGETVYYTENARNGWDGKYKGKEQPAGNYLWLIKLVTRDGDVISKKGNVLLIR